MLPSLTREWQVLVVGDGVPGLAVAGLLDRAGLDPVVLTEPESAAPSRITTLWAGGVQFLEARLGLGDVTRRGTHVEAIRARPGAGADTERCVAPDGPDPTRPVVVGTAELREALLGALGADATRLQTGLASASPRADQIDVEFANGVRESFDVVVGADGPGSSVRAAVDRQERDCPALVQVEAGLDRQASHAAAVNCLADGRCIQVVPGPGADGEATLRVTAPAGGTGPAFTPTEIDDPRIPPTDVIRDVTRTRVSQSVGPDGRWQADRLAFCGGAALPVAPASMMRTTLGLEDAWVLADELARDHDEVPAALRRYERRRARRLNQLFRQLREDGRTTNGEGRPEGPLDLAVSLGATAIDALDPPSVAGLSRPIHRRR